MRPAGKIRSRAFAFPGNIPLHRNGPLGLAPLKNLKDRAAFRFKKA